MVLSKFLFGVTPQVQQIIRTDFNDTFKPAAWHAVFACEF